MEMSRSQNYGPAQTLGKNFNILHNKVFVNTDDLHLRGTLVSWKINQYRITTWQQMSQAGNLPVALQKTTTIARESQALSLERVRKQVP